MGQPAKNIAVILLAAGTSARFGADKLVHPLEDGVAIAAHAARNLLAVTPDVIAVVRWDDIPLQDLLEEEGCLVAKCRTAARGMGASLAHGVGEAHGADGWVIALADMPRIAPATVKRVIEALQEGALIAAPSYQGQRGHPVGFGSALRDELLTLDGDQGAREVLERHGDAVKLLDCDDPGTLYDIDRKSDLRSDKA